jgi:hypothetical protein
MTDEEKLAAVEEALDHAELIAEARADFREFFNDYWQNFLTGYSRYAYVSCGRGYVFQMRNSNAHAIWDVLGEARSREIRDQEEAKFCNHLEAEGSAPEIIYVCFQGTDEERDSFPRYQPNFWNLGDDAEYYERHSKAVAEWVEDRKHLNIRKEYARKFYGAK